MGDKSKIEWTDASWNPIRARNLATGKIGWHCEHATTGCEFCYSEGFNLRLGTGLPFKPGHRADIELFLDDEMLTAPLRWKKPRKIFVCSMTDLFADFVKDEWIDRMFAVMALCPQHTFQVLTKRAERMRDYWSNIVDRFDAIERQLEYILKGIDVTSFSGRESPLRNLWLGVSCERQQEFDEREALLRATPAAVRFFSLEPLLGPISMRRAFYVGEEGDHEYVGSKRQMIDWVIVGGESGHRARPMMTNWARYIRDQCRAASVPFFFKQFGEYAETDFSETPERVGKKVAGRLLDGIEHNEFPARI